MNSRSTIVLVGIFLAIFWVGGLMMTVNRQRVDASYVMPTLQSASKVEIDSVVVERKGKETEEFKFVRKGDDWTLSQGSQAVKVEAFRVKDMIRAIRDAKRAEDDGGRPVDVSGGLAAFGLKPPQTVITLTGSVPKKDDQPAAKERTWSIFLGNESPDKKYVYAATSDAPDKVVALSREKMSSLLFKNVNDFRSKRLFEFSEPTVQSFSLKEGAQELEIKKSGGAWVFVKPDLGYAEADSPPPAKGAPPSPDAEGGVKALLSAIAAVRVDSEDDFVTSAADTLSRNDLLPGKEKFRIQVMSGDDKKPTNETLIVGREEKGFFYARLATDEGVFKLPAKLLTPLFEALKSPEKLRSRDLAPMPIKDADAVVLSQGKDEVRFLASGDPKSWTVDLPGSTRALANSKFVEKLLDTLQGRREIVAFKEVPAADAAKVDTELGFDQPSATVSVFLQGVESGKFAIAEPTLKKDAKAAATWKFGKVDGELVWVKRTLESGPAERFSVRKSILDTLVPAEGLIGYLEPVMPKVNSNDVVRIEIDRAGSPTVLEKVAGRWMLKDASGDVVADPRKIDEVLRIYSSLGIRRWVKKLDDVVDLDAYGLKSPSLTVTLNVKDALGAQAVGSALGQLGGITGDPALAALGAAWANAQVGEKIVFKFGKEAEKDDSGNVFVQSSQVGRIALATLMASNLVRDQDFRDRSTILNPQVQLTTLAIGQPAAMPFNLVMNAGPLTTLVVGRTSADKVKELRLTLRTPIEVRTFHFVRKDKTWVDQTGLKEFQVNDANIEEVAKIIAELKMDRVVLLTGGPKADQKLSAKDAVVVLEAAFNDLRPPITLTIGTNFEGFGCFAQVSTWPGAVFLINGDRVQPLLRGASYFAKERVAAN